jgi:hypothetical protein
MTADKLDAYKKRLESPNGDGDCHFTDEEVSTIYNALCELRNGIREAAGSLHAGRGEQVTPLVVNAVRSHLKKLLG